MIIPSPQVLAEYARDYRKQIGLSQSEIGDRTGLRQVQCQPLKTVQPVTDRFYPAMCLA
ncbi:MAG: hypothetical protein ACFCU8_16770 [Thermosynechococcaceae cyanobacterium]